MTITTIATIKDRQQAQRIAELEAEIERLTLACNKAAQAELDLLAERDALKLNAKRYLVALRKIAMTEYHIERPPIDSLEEQMRNIAIAAMKGAA